MKKLKGLLGGVLAVAVFLGPVETGLVMFTLEVAKQPDETYSWGRWPIVATTGSIAALVALLIIGALVYFVEKEFGSLRK